MAAKNPQEDGLQGDPSSSSSATSNPPSPSAHDQPDIHADAVDHDDSNGQPHQRRPPPPALRLTTELYTIDSQIAGPSPRHEVHADRLRPSTDRQNSAATRVSLTRPRQTFDELRPEVKAAMSSPIDFKDTIPPDLGWIARQRNRASKPWRKARSRAAKAYNQYVVEGLLRQKPLPPSKDGRHIPLKPGLVRQKSLKDDRTGHSYVSNFIRSSRYTVWNFLPKQLFFQFSKLANFYFLVIGILQMIPGLSTTGTYTTIGPLIAFVALSMAKEGYDDYRRYKLDKLENRSVAWVLDPEGTVKRDPRTQAKKSGIAGFFKKKDESPEFKSNEGARKTAPWAPVKWEDLRVGDIIQLRRDDNVPADVILLSASGPNGIAYIETMALDGETNLKSKQACPLLAEHCDSLQKMKACEAEIVSEDPNTDLYNYEGRVTVNGKTMPLTLNEIVYRGSTLRNTAKAVALVVNTGESCKIRLNAHKNARAKAPKMQKPVNRIVILLVFFVILLSVGCTIGYIANRHRERRAFYLQSERVPLSQIFIAFVIAYNTLIPLSLYVSLEIARLLQGMLLSGDMKMYDPVSDTPAKVNTTTILEDLGQVNYVFSDKTGTLTENLMMFRKMSIAGTAWLHDMDLQRKALQGDRTDVHEKTKSFEGPRGIRETDLMQEPLVEGRRSISAWRSTVRPTQAQPELKTEDLIRYIQQKPNSPFSRKARHFILCLAICHTCLPETDEEGNIKFQAASPDELALVEAAKDLGYLLVDRAAQSMKIQSRDANGKTVTETYRIESVIEFSSKRKRMSIVVRMPNGRLCIFTKGADSVILPRLKQKRLAIQTATAVERKASMRKSVEQEKALQRRSLQSPTRRSMDLIRQAATLDRKSSWRRSMINDGVENWLAIREAEGLDDQTGNEEAYYTPRTSMARASRSLDLARLTDPLDGMVDEALVLNEAAVFERCFQHVDDFATEGLRTLIYAYRYLDEKDFERWKATYHEATTSLTKRQERIEDAAELIEQDFELAGATAIEDKLQQGVPETIDKLRRANIKVWMLTGDKRETAINIAHSARICRPFSEVYILDATLGDLHNRILSTLQDCARGMIPHTVVVIDGQTLTVVEQDEGLKVLFYDLCARADSVICCRASPSQKAGLVKCIRRSEPGAITLAIGDGANDIAMIQASHVGVGISGREGLQAARVSDYAIAQFRFLQRLLFVHGRWNYLRIGKYILATFWKEVVFYLIQAQYQRANRYTGTSIFESANLAVFNTLFTSLAVIVPAVLEKDLSAETLLAIPELYNYGQKNKAFNFKLYLGWMFMAVSESIILYNSVYYIYAFSHFPVPTDLFSVGTLAYSLAIIFINIKLLVLEVNNRNIIVLGALLISVLGWWLWNIILALVYAQSPGPYMVKWAFLRGFGKAGMWWIVHIVVLSALVVFELVVTVVRRTFWPTDQDLAQEMEHVDGVMEIMKEHAAERGEGVLEVRAEESRGKDVSSLTTVPSSLDPTVRASADVPPVPAIPSPLLSPWRATSAFNSNSLSGRPSLNLPRRKTEEYVRRQQFPSPAEEPEDPMNRPVWSGPRTSASKLRHSIELRSPLSK
ncbi:putative phospholipid-transporting ATPase DNF3 [Podospora fimiseda]|uniref:Phospholipid-transporting ATPase n=1 Tax=Podospora fimiseda TaxID=252190 RepID=A0AAN7H2R4_9PEZI|nr:putative phospholipid-transporting ATPase DNF3 [Podospora fimiseda]